MNVSASELTRKLDSPCVRHENSVISIGGKKYIDFTSNDPFLLSQNKKLLEAVKQSFNSFGSTGSRLLSGDTTLFHRLEKDLATFLHKESALLYNSGYHANTGILPAVTTKDDLIISDKLCHASILDGIQLSKSKHLRFNHNNITHLETLLRTHRNDYQHCIIVTESLFSMDGDAPHFEKLIQLKKQYNCLIYVDAAHSFGVSGPNGEGVPLEALPHIDFYIATFGKAMGSYGAFIACSEDIKTQLINTSRSFMFSTALPIPVIIWNTYALALLPHLSKERAQLQHLSLTLKTALEKKGYSIPGTSHIVPVIIGPIQRTLKIADALKDKGLWIKAIRYPTVPHHLARLRLSLTLAHDTGHFHTLLTCL